MNSRPLVLEYLIWELDPAEELQPCHRLQVFSLRPVDVDARDFAQPFGVTVTEGGFEAEKERQRVCEVLCAILDKQVKVNVVRRVETTRSSGTRECNTVYEGADAQQA